MAVNFDNIYLAVWNAISASIGQSTDDLARLGGVPAIVRARESNTELPFPYATMDIITVTDTNSYLTNKYTNNQGHIIYDTHKNVNVQISVRGPQQVSYGLAQRVHKSFTFDSTRAGLRTTAQAVIASITDVTPTPDVLGTENLEANSFNIVLRVNDRDTDTSVTPLENSNITQTIRERDGSTIP